MAVPLVTRIPRDDADDGAVDPPPTVAILFNEKSGPEQVAELVMVRHAFCEFEVWGTEDEHGREAWLLAVWCETAGAEELVEMIGSRLPDYIQARRFPLSRIVKVRASGSRIV